MNWKLFLGQTFVIIIATVALVHLFYSDKIDTVYLQQRNFTSRLNYLEVYLKKMETEISVISRSDRPAILDAPAPRISSVSIDRHINELEQRIFELEQVLNDQAHTPRSSARTDIASLPSLPPETAASRNWLAALSPEKKSMVQSVYHEQLKFMQDSVSDSSGAYPPDPEVMRAILTESREQLEAKFRLILTEEEYQAFLNAGSTPFPPP